MGVQAVDHAGGVKAERLDAIRSHLYANGFSTIQSLADSVGASLATIRRDLQILERDGAIDRVHGGARIAEGSSVELAFQERVKRNIAAKRAIATAAYALLAPRTSIFLDAGTTVLQLARLIRINPQPLRIFTNGLAVAQEFLNISNLEVVLGGRCAARTRRSSVRRPRRCWNRSGSNSSFSVPAPSVRIARSTASTAPRRASTSAC
jgi:DeoR family fructose operon transcriptional repressor